MDPRTIPPLSHRLDATVPAPPSKSVTHRALIAAALARGTSAIRNPLDSEDTRITRRGLQALGVEILRRDDRWVVTGRQGLIPGGGNVELGASGTSLRLLLAVAALGEEPSSLDGAPRLRERPIEELVTALVALGARISTRDGGLPLHAGGALPRGGAVRVRGGRSSQFASALLAIGPLLQDGLDLTIEPPRVSLPYVELTAAVLRGFGAAIDTPEPGRYRVHRGALAARDYRIEGDHSSASYFLIAAALLGGRVRVEGLDPESLQPDRCVVGFLERVGCRVVAGDVGVEVEGDRRIRPFDADLTDAPDLGPGLAALALHAEGSCVLRGARHLRHKESDRVELLARNLRALGAKVQVGEDRLEIEPPSVVARDVRIETGSDHRIAMAFAVVGLRSGVTVDDAACVDKSNPQFWIQLDRLRARGRQNWNATPPRQADRR